MSNTKNKTDTKFIVNVGVFSAIAFILQYIGSLIGLKFGGFLDIEISDIPPLILSFFYGPLAGLLCEFIKNLLHCTITTTGYIGELANFAVNGTMCFAVAVVYKYKRTLKGAILSLAVGVAVMSLVGIATNLFIMLPLYMKGADFASRLSVVLCTILPFNIVRGIVISILTFLLYKKVSRMLPK